ncbi:MFS transporter [Limnochorda pilosa]|uniref:Uncharacterized protein n=1 Tax=Limnochorda pilosa TaxID=1555112 RepID=A0A0K2SM07_LIMPI|nr:MFS transporter [Limnochorda pilosa]BAS28140.1 hypothetical protein LIP_2299 [Limnochorda pilosa]
MGHAEEVVERARLRPRRERVVQETNQIVGNRAGAMLSMPRATVGDIFSPRERGR